jgi:hypothetical protein
MNLKKIILKKFKKKKLKRKKKQGVAEPPPWPVLGWFGHPLTKKKKKKKKKNSRSVLALGGHPRPASHPLFFFCFFNFFF